MFDRKAYNKQWRLNNPDKIKGYTKKWAYVNSEYNSRRQRKYQLMLLYGITEEYYEELLLSQGYKCKICGTDTPTGKWKVFCVDHDHKTNKIRGLLCNECNRGIGLLGDDINRLQNAVNYLKDHKKKTKKEQSET